jgi:hypothetical protein
MTLGFLQLCSDLRFHRRLMEAFEGTAGLRPDEYWIEARPGGAPAWRDNSRMSRIAYREGAEHMGWAGHGAGCRGFPGVDDAELRKRVEHAARSRAEEFPRANHYLLFVAEGDVEIVRVRSRT